MASKRSRRNVSQQDEEQQEEEMTEYEKKRQQRIKENKERLEKMGILDLAKNLKPAPKPNKKPLKPAAAPADLTSTRRSSRYTYPLLLFVLSLFSLQLVGYVFNMLQLCYVRSYVFIFLLFLLLAYFIYIVCLPKSHGLVFKFLTLVFAFLFFFCSEKSIFRVVSKSEL